MASSEAKNLKAIKEAVDRHASNCPFPAVEIALNPYEVERLGWTELFGIPVVGDDKLGTGRFEVRCQRDKTGDDHKVEETEKLEALA